MNNQQTNDVTLAGNSYDLARDWIRNRRSHGTKWDALLLANKQDDAALQSFLARREEEDFWPHLTCDQWKELVLQQQEQEISDKENGAAMLPVDGENGLHVREDEESAWQKYRHTLLTEKEFKRETVDTIESATFKILKKLSTDTTDCDAVKGMVVGNVQSGKTANMAALMAMAADYAWNMFIVLSGSIENLRVQTANRLYADLNHGGNITWKNLTYPNIADKDHPEQMPQNLDLAPGSHVRYLTVCLKEPSRLRNLIRWLQYNPAKQEQMNIVVIEDEADQASINTARMNLDRQEDLDNQDCGDEATRRTINKLICRLVSGKKADGTLCNTKYHAMNYIGYTATPYANLLNEAGNYSLYPRDFITTLAVSKAYFGPQQIFGYSGINNKQHRAGLDIVRGITDKDKNIIELIHKDQLRLNYNSGNDFIFDDAYLPQSLTDAICWFLCGVSCMRYWKYKKPISMLIHTSQKTDPHKFMAKAIKNWLAQTDKTEIIRCCEEVWTRETTQFPLAKFHMQYPDYEPDNTVQDYPPFDDIRNGILTIINRTIDPIFLNDKGIMEYHEGIHLCVDNSAGNVEFVRLAYPNSDHMPTPAPAFIVVGGATLSRGLTIEGLISTYFMRAGTQADTLMQMGRWFGYRKHYELMPRIWMEKTTKDKFVYLAKLDQDLRNEIADMAVQGQTPSDYAPHMQMAEKYLNIKIVAKNRQQGAVQCNINYSGTFSQTTLFDNDKASLQANYEAAETFLHNLGTPGDQTANHQFFPNTIVWRNVDVKKITEFLRCFHFSDRQRVFNDINALAEWMEKQPDFSHWNVITAGKRGLENGEWFTIGNTAISKVQRSQKKYDTPVPGIIDIHALVNPRDLLADINVDTAGEDVRRFIQSGSCEGVRAQRENAGLKTTPQLLLYCIDKDSKADSHSDKRTDLNAQHDIIGLSILIPGGRRNRNYAATVAMNPKYLIDKDIENGEDNA